MLVGLGCERAPLGGRGWRGCEVRCFRGLVGGGCLVGWLVGRKSCYIMSHSPLPTMIDLLLNYMYASRTLLL